MQSVLLTGLALLSLTGLAQAQALASDDFDYNGALTSNGWAAHSGAGNKLILSDGARATLSQGSGSGEDVNLGFPALTATDTVYASFDFLVPSGSPVDPDGSGLYFAHFKNSGSTFRGRTGLLSPGGGGDFALAVNADNANLGAGTTWPGDLSFDTLYKVVVSWNAATDEGQLWLDPVNMASASISHTGTSFGALMAGFALRQSNDYTGLIEVDNVVVGKTFDDALFGGENVTPDVIFGSGNANGSYTIERRDTVELGMRGKLRFDPSNLPANIFNSNGDGSYTFSVGAPTGGAGWVAATTPIWNFEWSVNSDFTGGSGLFLDDLTYEIGMDFDPSPATNYLVFDPITPGAVPYWDHALGTNATGNGGGLSYGSNPAYVAALAANNVAQQSWNMEFFNDPPFDTFDPSVPGAYQYYLAAFDSGTEVGRTAITIHAVNGMTLSLEGDPCQTDQDAGTSGIQIEVELWLRNPDDLPTTGYQAFLAYDSGAMTYEGGLSSYSAAPFESHIGTASGAMVAANELRLDGNTFNGPYSGDALLATLVFTVSECDPQAVSFDLGQLFASEVSYIGVPYATDLLDSAAIVGDITPPVLTVPADITVSADANVGGGCTSAVVNFTPTATDTCSTTVTIECTPPSGTAFPAGVTTPVTCVATDECGNTDTDVFMVTVNLTNTVTLDVQLVGSDTVATRCIHFVLDNACGSTADIPLVFNASGLFSGDIEVPCGTWSSICAKDRQHTEWDTSALTLSGTKWVASTTLNLQGGDTDNDGDVDINDVTWLLVQYGSATAAGACPYVGTPRDADFSNNGQVFTEDYSILSSNWLTLTSCGACSVTGGGGRRSDVLTRTLTTAETVAADLTDDGWIDWRDVAVFELRNGLPNGLSSAMRSRR